MKPYFIHGILAVALLAAPGLKAGDAGELQSELYRTSVAQDTLRKDAAAIYAQISAMRDETSRLDPAQLKSLGQAMQRLDELTRTEMSRVTETLKAASQSKDPAVQTEKLKAAARDQIAIREKLQRISADLSARQVLDKLVPAMLELLRRQGGAAAEVTALAQSKTPPAWIRSGPLKERYDAVTNEQDLLAEEIQKMVRELAETVDKLPEETRTAPANAVKAARDQKVAEYADAAAKSLRGAPFQNVLDSQKSVEKTLCAMIAAMQTAEKRLQYAIQEISELIKIQTDIASQIKALPEKKEIPLAVFQRQRDAGNRTAILGEELHGIHERSIGILDGARDAMEKSVTALEKKDRPAVPPLQQTAVEKLSAAKELLEKIASQPPPATSQQLAKELSSLSRELAQAAADQNRAAAQTPSTPPTPEQKEALQGKVQELQEQALKSDPNLAKTLGDAAEKMKQPDAASQQQAAQDLTKASQELANRAAALNGQLPEQQALSRVESQVAQTAKALQAEQAQMESGKQASSDAVNQLNALQPQISSALQAAAAAHAPAEAQKALVNAKQALDAAAISAAQTKMDAAKGAAQRSQGALKQAQQSLAQARDAMAQTGLSKDLSGRPMAQSGQDQSSNSSNSAPNAAMAAGASGNGQATPGDGGDQLIKGHGEEGGPAQVVTGLNPKDREAITLLQGEKPPREFETQVQQYYKNLADSVGF